MKVSCCGCDFKHENGEFCPRKNVPEYFISYFSTPFLYEVNGQLQEGKAGDLLIVPPNCDVYHGPISKCVSFTNDWMYVRGDDMTAIFEHYPLPFNQAFHMEHANLLKNCLQKINEELCIKKTGYEEIISCYLTSTIIQMHRSYQNQYRSDSVTLRIESVREMILQNLSKNWTLQEMAELSEYSVSHFSALYAKRFGLSPKADLLQNRIELAKQLLRYSDQSVTEIAKRCGFQSIYYFSKYFKDIVGVAPSEYVKM